MGEQFVDKINRTPMVQSYVSLLKKRTSVSQFEAVLILRNFSCTFHIAESTNFARTIHLYVSYNHHNNNYFPKQE
jgi:hypothetical protein